MEKLLRKQPGVIVNTMLFKILAGVSYIAMLVVNFLANTLPLNNRSTGAISAAYPTLFTPSGLTFSIWGLIYLLLGGYVLYQFVKKNQEMEELSKKINPLFIATSIANSLWIFAWHYDYIGFSVLIMILLLVLLIRIADILRTQQFKAREKFLIRVPFSVYFGWITVAAIANITVFLVSISWNGFGIAEYIWTSIILVIGAVIGILRMSKDNNIAYGLVVVWAYLGILLKHLSSGGFGGQYPSIIAIVIVCLVLLIFFVGKQFIKINKKILCS